MQGKTDSKLIRNGNQILRTFGPDDTPVSVPDFLYCRIRSGDTGPRAISALRIKEFLSIEIADCEMCKIDVADIPCKRVRGIAVYAFTEKSELEAELASVSGLQISGVVPPFGLVIGMVEIIAREFITVAGPRRFELSETGWRREK